MDIAFTYAKMTGRHLKVGTSRRAAEVATNLAMMVNEDEDGRTGIPKGTKARALTLEELADKKRQRALGPTGAWLQGSHFRTVAELKEDFTMGKKQKAAPAATTTTATAAVGTGENTTETGAGTEGAATESCAANTGSDTSQGAEQGAAPAAPAKGQKAEAFKAGPDLLLFFKKHPERDIQSTSMRHKIMAHAYQTGGKIKLSQLNEAMGQNVRSDVKTLIKLEHCVEVAQAQFDAIPSDPITFVGATKTTKPVPPKPKAKTKPATTVAEQAAAQAAAGDTVGAADVAGDAADDAARDADTSDAAGDGTKAAEEAPI